METESKDLNELEDEPDADLLYLAALRKEMQYDNEVHVNLEVKIAAINTAIFRIKAKIREVEDGMASLRQDKSLRRKNGISIKS